jgi:FkbM family methyltransferase
VLLWRFSSDPGLLREERRHSSGWTSSNLRKENFSPVTVIDVGAQRGTRALYDAFPDSFHVLIEPLQEFEESLQRWAKELNGEYLVTAVGDREGTTTIHVDPKRRGTSSILRNTLLPPDVVDRVQDRQIPVTTLDTLLEQRRWTGPFGLKIDTEGYERHVIEGATRLLEQTQFVIAEVWVSERYDGGYSFAEFISLMDRRGFKLCDVLDGLKLSPQQDVSYIDVLFRRGSERVLGVDSSTPDDLVRAGRGGRSH